MVRFSSIAEVNGVAASTAARTTLESLLLSLQAETERLEHYQTITNHREWSPMLFSGSTSPLCSMYRHNSSDLVTSRAHWALVAP